MIELRHAPRQILSLWWPLAASSVLMSIEMPFVNSGIARTANPEIALAGFGLAASLAFLTEAPIVMLNGTTAALGRNWAAFKLLERFTIHLGIVVTAFNFLLSFTPLFDVVVTGWMGVPAPVAAACLPAFRIFLLWPAPIGWRRFHQGMLIRMHRTSLISAGTLVRLAISVGLTLVTIFVLRLPAQSGGALALVVSVFVESLLITYWARRLMRDNLDDKPREPALRYGQLLHFYVPLMMVSGMGVLAQPFISTGLSRAAFPTESLATWPTIWGLTMLIGGLCQPLQEATIAVLDGPNSLRRVRSFGLTVGALATALLSLAALTPLADLYFGQLVGLPVDLRVFSDRAIILMMGYPLWISIEMMLRGFLIKQQRTRAIRMAMACNVVTLSAALAVGVFLGIGTGVQIAAIAVNLAIGAEILTLAVQALPLLQGLRPAATAA